MGRTRVFPATLKFRSYLSRSGLKILPLKSNCDQMKKQRVD